MSKPKRAGLWRVLLLVLAATFSVAGLIRPASAAPSAGSRATVLTMSGPLTPAQATYLERALNRAEQDQAEVVILQLNTPGGQIELMQKMVNLIRGSRVPVVVFVAPQQAMAGSAGTVITLAGWASAMTPESIIGAASPVGGQGENLDSTLEAKLKEALKAQVRVLAAGRRPEAIALAESTIELAKAATAQEALAAGMVDFLAQDVPDLLRQLDGYTVHAGDQARTLHTAGLPVDEVGLNLLETALDLLTNPNVVFLLLTLGAQALLIELSSPGGWVAGFIGVVALALAFYGLGVLPVNYFGLVFIGLAFVLLILETHAPTHGALAATGTASLIVGALVLFNSPGSPDFFRVSVPLVVGTAIVVAAGFVVLVTFALRAQRRPLLVGVESLVGREGLMRQPGQVQVAGELWSAEAAGDPLRPGERVVVEGVDGLKLRVRAKKP
ncbi:MAG: nodulation protein NfeD [Anaerolineales bacterium]